MYLFYEQKMITPFFVPQNVHILISFINSDSKFVFLFIMTMALRTNMSLSLPSWFIYALFPPGTTQNVHINTSFFWVV